MTVEISIITIVFEQKIVDMCYLDFIRFKFKVLTTFLTNIQIF